MKETLSASRWGELATRLQIVDSVKVFRALEVHYEGRSRKYHTAHHINECLSEFARARHPEAANPLVEYALWFHDAVYNTFSSKNELKSADWAAHVLEKSHAPPVSIDAVRSLIMATCHGVQPSDPAQQLLVDVDLAILGADATATASSSCRSAPSTGGCRLRCIASNDSRSCARSYCASRSTRPMSSASATSAWPATIFPGPWSRSTSAPPHFAGLRASDDAPRGAAGRSKHLIELATRHQVGVAVHRSPCDRRSSASTMRSASALVER